MEPPEEIAPLAPAWPFGIYGENRWYIREERFAVAWKRYRGDTGLIVSLGLLTEYGPTARNVSSWALYNLEEIAGKWEQVMDLLEEQTSVPVSAHSSLSFPLGGTNPLMCPSPSLSYY